MKLGWGILALFFSAHSSLGSIPSGPENYDCGTYLIEVNFSAKHSSRDLEFNVYAKTSRAYPIRVQVPVRFWSPLLAHDPERLLVLELKSISKQKGHGARFELIGKPKLAARAPWDGNSRVTRLKSAPCE